MDVENYTHYEAQSEVMNSAQENLDETHSKLKWNHDKKMLSYINQVKQKVWPNTRYMQASFKQDGDGHM